MYRQNAKQKNKPNLILVSFFLSRSSLKPRPKPAQTVHPQNLEYAINSQDAKRGEQTRKVRNQQVSRAENIYRRPLVTLTRKSTHELQTSTLHLKCFQQIFAIIKTVTKIILGNGIELLQCLIRQRKQHLNKTYIQELFSFYKIDN